MSKREGPAEAVTSVPVCYHCDECGAEMTATGDCLLSSPPQYPHRCPNGHRKNLPRTYPGRELRYS